ncbi:signal recognition particle subunit [Thecaphora frezii]
MTMPLMAVASALARSGPCPCQRLPLPSAIQFELPTIGSAAAAASPQQRQPSQQDQMAAFQKMMEQMQMGQGDFGSSRGPVAAASKAGGAGQASDEHKRWVSVYPIYFDAKRHYEKGCRRVALDKASPFPTQLWIAKAVSRLQFRYVQEPFKTHPQDWANPGRVKVMLFDDDGKPVNPNYSNKKQLFNAIAEILQPNCGGKPPPVEPRTKRTKPSAVKAAAIAENAKRRAANAMAAPSKKGGKASAGAAAPSSSSAKPFLTRKQKQEINKLRRDPNPNPIRARLAQIKFPPRLEDRLPEHSPALEGGVLNMNIAEAMGGMPGGGAGMMEQLGPLGGMLGGMGLGGDDDDDDEEEQESEATKKKAQEKQMPNLSRRQKKKVVRIGR